MLPRELQALRTLALHSSCRYHKSGQIDTTAVTPLLGCQHVTVHLAGGVCMFSLSLMGCISQVATAVYFDMFCRLTSMSSSATPCHLGTICTTRTG